MWYLEKNYSSISKWRTRSKKVINIWSIGYNDIRVENTRLTAILLYSKKKKNRLILLIT